MPTGIEEKVLEALRLYANDFNWFERAEGLAESHFETIKRSPVYLDHGDKAREALKLLEGLDANKD